MCGPARGGLRGSGPRRAEDGLLRASGGEVRTGAEVQRVLTDGDRATGVVLASGERIGARRVVIANVTPTVLFDHLLADRPLPRAVRAKVDGYVYGPGTMMVHLALKGKLRWAVGPELDEFAYVHIAPYVSDLARTYTAALNGLIPTSPFLVVGQTSAVDPTRAPGDAQVLWIQVRTLPSHIWGDAAGEIAARTWDEAKEPVADRVMDKLQTYAPNLKEQILARAVFSPADLERDNPNLVGGDSIAGSHHLRQHFLFRPFPGWSRYRMPVAGLYLVGAATWPGAGNNATSGYLAARQILEARQVRRWAIGSSAGAGAGAVTAATLIATREARGGRR